MDDFSEIDRFVEELFHRPIDDLEALDNEWRMDRIDQVIQETYEEIQRWHNGEISKEADPESGLIDLPHIPWDESLDGVAAMMGLIGDYDPQPGQVGGYDYRPPWVIAGVSEEVYMQDIYQRMLREQAEAPSQTDEIPLRRVLLIIAAVLSVMTIITAILATV